MKVACENNIRVLVDAEHSYFQPAIDNTALRMQRKYNKVCEGVQPMVCPASNFLLSSHPLSSNRRSCSTPINVI